MKQPNILFITSDQQHWDTIGRFNPDIQTPNLDRLCREGTYFSRAYTVNPTCTPTRCTWLTGLMPSQHGAWTLGTKLQESVHTINEDFAAAGYRTALIGKAHFQPLTSTEKYPSLEAYPILQDQAFWKHYDGKFYGFDHVELARNHTNEAHVGQHYALWLEEKGCKNWRDYFVAPTGTMDKQKELVWDIPEEFHYDNWIAERTNAMLSQYKENGEAFCLWADFFDPHPPYLVPEPWASMYDPEKITVPEKLAEDEGLSSPFYAMTQEDHPDASAYNPSGFLLHGVHSHKHDREHLKKQVAVYYGMVSMMDHYIGKILDHLDELGLADNTVVIFTTDHGHYYGHHGLIAKGPFHYEDAIRVPMIVRCPGAKHPGTVSAAIQSELDLPCTMLDLCGIERPDGIGGISQKAVWMGETDAVRHHAICEFNHERDAVNLRTLVNDRYKITVYQNLSCGELFDLQEDPKELHNLWDKPEAQLIKLSLLQEFVQAEMEQEPRFMPRIDLA